MSLNRLHFRQHHQHQLGDKHLGTQTGSVYSATKAAVDAVTKSLIRYCRTAPIARLEYRAWKVSLEGWNQDLDNTKRGVVRQRKIRHHAAVTLINHVHRSVIAPQSQLAAFGVTTSANCFAMISGLSVLACISDQEHPRARRAVGAGEVCRRAAPPIRVLAATLEDRRGLNASLILEKQVIARIEYLHAGRQPLMLARQKRS